jgi:hypothetical protein
LSCTASAQFIGQAIFTPAAFPDLVAKRITAHVPTQPVSTVRDFTLSVENVKHVRENRFAQCLEAVLYQICRPSLENAEFEGAAAKWPVH